MNSQGALYVGEVTHQRLRPLRHRLRYRMFSMLVDLDELDALSRRLRLFSVDRFNLFSLHRRDHGAGDGSLREHVDRQLLAAGLPPARRIELLAMPRLLGYVFNPLSIYFCRATDGALQAVMYEVNSTFGERHAYLLPVEPEQTRDGIVLQRCDKAMHVSPFLGMQMHYTFRVEPPSAHRDGLCITVAAHDADGPVLVAAHRARRTPLTDGRLAGLFVMQPLHTIKVMMAIHWEALRLWLKGLRTQPRPEPSAASVSHPRVRQ